MRKVKFETDNSISFYRTLNKRVAAYFQSKGITYHANRWMMAKLIFCFVLFFGLYLLILSDILALPYLLLSVFLFGIASTLIGFNIAHDAGHGALFSSPHLNKMFSYSFELIGMSSYAWHLKHNIVHHNNPNLQDGDFDIESGPILRFSPADKLLPHHRYQHIYAPFVYFLFSLSLVFFDDVVVLFKTRRENIDGKKHVLKDKIIFITAKLCYLFFMLILPMMLMHYKPLEIVFGFVLMHFTLSIILAMVLIPAHLFEHTQYPSRNGDGKINDDWAIYQMKTTLDYSRKSWLCNFLFGGLNINVVHHLFPKICHVHLIPISDIVKETAREFGIVYHELTILGAMRSHLKILRQLGRNEKYPPSI
jgi:linoleoyl-CoA desaturase